MKEFSSTAFFRIRDEKAFNDRVKILVGEWKDYQARTGHNDVDPVSMAIGEALRDPSLAIVSTITRPERADINKTLASWRSENAAPETFRAMFSEEVPAC